MRVTTWHGCFKDLCRGMTDGRQNVPVLTVTTQVPLQTNQRISTTLSLLKSSMCRCFSSSASSRHIRPIVAPISQIENPGFAAFTCCHIYSNNRSINVHTNISRPVVSLRRILYILCHIKNKKAVLSQRCVLYKWIEWAVAEIWPFEIIQDGDPPPTWNWCNRK